MGFLNPSGELCPVEFKVLSDTDIDEMNYEVRRYHVAVVGQGRVKTEKLDGEANPTWIKKMR